MNRRHLQGNFVDNLEALFRKTRAKLKKKSSTLQQETSSNQEVSSGTCLQNSKSWRTNQSASSQLSLWTTSALDLLQRSTTTLSSGLDLSTWCNPTSSVGRHTEMLVLISNTSWRFVAHSPYQESPEMLYYFASSHSQCWGERSSGSMLQKRRILHGHSVP